MSILRTQAGHTLGPPTRVLDRSTLTDDVRALSKVSDLRAVLAVGREWLLVALAVYAAVISEHAGVWVCAGIWIATRQHALLVLMHESAHFRLTRNRRINDLVGDLLLALPNNVLLRRYRILHAAHHRFANDRYLDPDRRTIEGDDQWQFPRTRSSAAWVFLRDLMGLNAGRMVRAILMYSPWPVVLAHRIPFDPSACSAYKPATRPELTRIAVFLAVLGGGLTASGGWAVYAALWVLPSLTVLPALLRLRGIAEHEGDLGTDEVSVSRHVCAGAAEAFLIAPFHINHHVAHHLYPSVPWYNLPALHARLLQEPSYRQHLVQVPSYTGPGGVVSVLMPADANTTEVPVPAR